MATERIMKYNVKKKGLEHQTHPVFPQGTGEKLEEGSRGQEGVPRDVIAEQSKGCLVPALPLYHCIKN